MNTPIGRGSPGIGPPERLEVELDEAAIDGGELLEIGDGHMLVDLVDGRGQQPELDHRAIILDEARVGRAAVGGELRRDPGDLVHRLGEQRIERSGLGQEGMARRLEIERERKFVAGERHRACSLSMACSDFAEWRSLKRMLKRASAAAGITFTT